MTYSKIYFSFVLFLTIFGNVNAQQAILFPHSNSVAILVLDGEDEGITLKPINHKDAKDYTKLTKAGSYNVLVINKEISTVYISLWRNGGLVNRLKLEGQKVASIVTLNPGDTLEINSIVNQEEVEKRKKESSTTIQSKLD